MNQDLLKKIKEYLEDGYQYETECSDEEVKELYKLFAFEDIIDNLNKKQRKALEDIQELTYEMCLNEYAGNESGCDEAFDILRAVRVLIKSKFKENIHVEE